MAATAKALRRAETRRSRIPGYGGGQNADYDSQQGNVGFDGGNDSYSGGGDVGFAGNDSGGGYDSGGGGFRLWRRLF